MNDDIKEILDYLQENSKKDGATKQLVDYITNLQQGNQELNDSITWWNNRFNAVQRDYEELKQENERLKVKYNEEKSHQINYNYFETLYSKSTKEIVIDDLVWKCEELDNFKKEYEKSYIEKEDYKSRIEKAVEYIKNVIKPRRADTSFHSNPIYILEMTYLLNILNGRSDK